MRKINSKSAFILLFFPLAPAKLHKHHQTVFATAQIRDEITIRNFKLHAAERRATLCSGYASIGIFTGYRIPILFGYITPIEYVFTGYS